MSVCNIFHWVFVFATTLSNRTQFLPFQKVQVDMCVPTRYRKKDFIQFLAFGVHFLVQELELATQRPLISQLRLWGTVMQFTLCYS